MTTIQPWDHQLQTLDLYRTSPEVFDMSDAGTGKTIANLLAFAERRRKGGGKGIIFAPKALLEPAWAEDCMKATPDINCRVAYASNRSDAFGDTDADLYITNNDAVKWVRKYPRVLQGVDTISIDESSNFKHRDSDRSKAMKWVMGRPEIIYRALLSATPWSKSVTELWHQVLLLDRGMRFGTAFSKFRDAVQIGTAKDPRFPQYLEFHDREGADELVMEMLSDICIRHSFEEVMPHVPENRSYYVKYNLPPKLQAFYDRLAEEAYARMQAVAEGEDDPEIIAANAAVLRNKLLQVASGNAYGEGRRVAELDKSRTELLTELIASRQHSVTFYLWGHQRKALIDTLTKRKIKWTEIAANMPAKARNDVVRNYQDGQYQTLLMHPNTGAHGLTLTRGTATIWGAPHDRPDLIYQGKKRVHRGNQDKETENIMVAARNTLDIPVYKNLFDNLSSSEKFLKMVEVSSE